MNKLWAIVVFFVVVLSTALIVTAGIDDAGNEYNVYGQVIDAKTGEGIKAVIVFDMELSSVEPVKLETSDEGKFQANLRAGWHSYYIEASGFEPTKGEFTLEKNSTYELMVRLLPKEENPEGEGDINEKICYIKGQVLANKERPLPGAMVVFYPIDEKEDKDDEEDKKTRCDGTNTDKEDCEKQ